MLEIAWLGDYSTPRKPRDLTMGFFKSFSLIYTFGQQRACSHIYLLALIIIALCRQMEYEFQLTCRSIVLYRLFGAPLQLAVIETYKDW